jgi:FixJ family two-component response regulator
VPDGGSGIFELVAEGTTDAQVAQQLFVTEQTVKVHLTQHDRDQVLGSMPNPLDLSIRSETIA